MLVASDLPGGLSHAFVRARALALGGRNEKVVALDREGAGVPVCGDETERGHISADRTILIQTILI